MADTQSYGIRKYLTDRGYKDEDINWDPTRKMVTLQGRDFIGATPQSDDKTYATGDALSEALGKYKGVSQQAQTNTRSAQIDTLANQMMQRAQAAPVQFNKPEPFSYNPETDPQYQAALRQAQQNAQTAGNNAMVELGSRGIGNSSITGDRVAQIQQKELGRVSDTVLPQLMQQAYGRYVDQANMDRQNQLDNYNATRDQDARLAAIAQYLSGEDQRAFGNEMASSEAENQQKQQRIALAQWLTDRYGVNAVPKMDTGVAFDQVSGLSPLVTQQFEEDKRRYGDEYALKKLAQEHGMSMDQAQLAISRANAGTSASNSAFNQLMDIWKATGQAPRGISGVEPGTPYGGTSGPTVKPKTAEDYFKSFDESMFVSPESKTDEFGQTSRTGKMVVNDAAGLERAILSLGLQDSEAKKLYYRYGLKWGG